MSAPDLRALRDAFGAFMTGVTIVTARRPDGTPVGFTANSFSSVSLDPALLLVCPGKYLSSFDAFEACSHFAVSVLAEGQEEIANIFARSKDDRFAQVPHTDDLHGVPLIDGSIAQFSCTTHQIVEAGDHCVLIGQVVDFAQTAQPGLGYVSGRFFSLGTERAALDHVEGRTVAGAIVAAGDTVLLECTADGFRPPECANTDRGALLAHLRETLEQHGISAALGQAYSVFDDAKHRIHHSYFLATGTLTLETADIIAVPICDLPTLTYTSPAIATMMHRFATEARGGSFGLYFGDTEHGAVHSPTDRM